MKSVQSAGITSCAALLLAASCSPGRASDPPVTAAQPANAGSRATQGRPSVTVSPFGTFAGAPVELYTVENGRGLVLEVTTYGATITALRVPDARGQVANVVLGFDSLEPYLRGTPYFGALIGRVANRIRGARFELGGAMHVLTANAGPHHLHGGVRGWDKVLWRATATSDDAGAAVHLHHVSPDGEQGYPGTMTGSVTYALTREDELRITMRGTTDRATIVNLAQHTYWNLAGSGTVLDHELTLFADARTPGDPIIPTGAVVPTRGTAFDFSRAKPLGEELSAVGAEPPGFDHNFVVSGAPHALRPVARLAHPGSGRVMELSADQPGVQLYTANHLDGSLRGRAGPYERHAGVCLETQAFPNAINIPAWRDQVILEPGHTYEHHMVVRFTSE